MSNELNSDVITPQTERQTNYESEIRKQQFDILQRKSTYDNLNSRQDLQQLIQSQIQQEQDGVRSSGINQINKKECKNNTSNNIKQKCMNNSAANQGVTVVRSNQSLHQESSQNQQLNINQIPNPSPLFESSNIQPSQAEEINLKEQKQQSYPHRNYSNNIFAISEQPFQLPPQANNIENIISQNLHHQYNSINENQNNKKLRTQDSYEDQSNQQQQNTSQNNNYQNIQNSYFINLASNKSPKSNKEDIEKNKIIQKDIINNKNKTDSSILNISTTIQQQLNDNKKSDQNNSFKLSSSSPFNRSQNQQKLGIVFRYKIDIDNNTNIVKRGNNQTNNKDSVNNGQDNSNQSINTYQINLNNNSISRDRDNKLYSKNTHPSLITHHVQHISNSQSISSNEQNFNYKSDPQTEDTSDQNQTSRFQQNPFRKLINNPETTNQQINKKEQQQITNSPQNQLSKNNYRGGINQNGMTQTQQRTSQSPFQNGLQKNGNLQNSNQYKQQTLSQQLNISQINQNASKVQNEQIDERQDQNQTQNNQSFNKSPYNLNHVFDSSFSSKYSSYTSNNLNFNQYGKIQTPSRIMQAQQQQQDLRNNQDSNLEYKLNNLGSNFQQQLNISQNSINNKSNVINSHQKHKILQRNVKIPDNSIQNNISNSSVERQNSLSISSNNEDLKKMAKKQEMLNYIQKNRNNNIHFIQDQPSQKQNESVEGISQNISYDNQKQNTHANRFIHNLENNNKSNIKQEDNQDSSQSPMRSQKMKFNKDISNQKKTLLSQQLSQNIYQQKNKINITSNHHQSSSILNSIDHLQAYKNSQNSASLSPNHQISRQIQATTQQKFAFKNKVNQATKVVQIQLGDKKEQNTSDPSINYSYQHLPIQSHSSKSPNPRLFQKY